ncbi:uncharacterized protein LOC110118082 isoform X2 [Ceratitis capitata]|uniref:uncharacterized protein LOC110118082 isoform X2 n=1 Tax=Ceratitis capitata TaxID=7213 RepID=UPI000A103581|nr:uncharacterized protein LOC110118082 isoform X2 [Ceratitis capitata]
MDYDESTFDKGGVAGGGYLLGLIAFAQSRTTITALAPPLTPPQTTIELHMRAQAQAHRNWPMN